MGSPTLTYLPLSTKRSMTCQLAGGWVHSLSFCSCKISAVAKERYAEIWLCLSFSLQYPFGFQWNYFSSAAF
jgi:hypothetical protein